MESIVINIDAELGQGLTRALDILEKLGKVSKADADAFRAMNQASAQMAQGAETTSKKVDMVSQSLDKVNKKQGIKVVDPSQLGLIESVRARLAQLADAQVKATDPKRLERINSLIASQNQRLRELQGTAQPVTKSLGFVNSALAGIGQAIAGAFAIQTVINFASESVRAFQEAERSALSLRSAVSVNGGLQADFDELINQSNELQKKTIFSDDAIQRAQTAALQFGLTKEQVEALIPVVADFASATGQDLQTALDGVLQGVNGMGRGLKIYGVTIDETQTATERLSDITGQLTKKFDDQAEAIGKTAFGAAEKYKNELDDIQERLGERLAPILNDIRASFLGAAGAAIQATEAVKKFFQSDDEKNAGAMQEAVKANADLIESYRQGFASLDNQGLTDNIEIVKKLLNEQKEQVKGLSAEEAKSHNNLIQQYAAQLTALIQIQSARSGGNKALSEQAAALEKLKNISSLSNAELLKIKKTLEGFNDVNLRDEISLIEKTIENRKKAGEKEIADREKNLEILGQLEQKASDRLLAVKASEVSKAVELEQEKQRELRNLVEAAGKASGADVEPILVGFESTGVTDIEKTIKLLQEAKFSTDEIDKFTQAVFKTGAAFDDLIEKEKQAQAEIDIKINIEKVTTEFTEFKSELEDLQTSKEIEIRTKFVQDGDFSSEAFEKLQKDIGALSEDTFKKLIAQAKAYGVDQAIIDKLILDNKEDASKKAVDAAEEETARKIELAEQELRKRQEIAEQIVDAANQALSLISDTTNENFNRQIESIDEYTNRFLESLDERAEANEEMHDKNLKGDRDYENEKKKIDEERKKAEDKADRDKRKLLREQAAFQKAISISQATINLALSISSALSTVPPASYVFAALNAVLAAAELAAVIATPIPSFAKGKEKIQGPGTETSDEVHVKVSRGERVVTAEKNRRYWDMLSAIHHGKHDPEAVNMLASYSKEELRTLTKVDKTLLKELSVATPVFVNPAMPQVIQFRNDIVPQIQASRTSVNVVNQTDPQLNEYDIARALDKGTRIKNVKEIAREMAEELAKLQNPYEKYR